MGINCDSPVVQNHLKEIDNLFMHVLLRKKYGPKQLANALFYRYLRQFLNSNITIQKYGNGYNNLNQRPLVKILVIVWPILDIQKKNVISKIMMSNRPILIIQALYLFDDMRYYVASSISFSLGFFCRYSYQLLEEETEI